MTKSVKRTALAVMTALLFLVVMLFVGACDGNKLVRLTFVTNGGTEIAAIEDKAGAQITPPNDPTRDGYTFDGWYLTQDFTGEATTIPSVMPKNDTVYYAKWTKLELALLTLDAGEGGTISQTKYEVAVGTNLASFLADVVPTVEEGLEFDNWYNGAVAIDETSYMPAAPLKLQAKYFAQYSVDVYKQALNGTWSDATSITGKAHFGESFRYENDEAHFHIDNTVVGAYTSTQRLGKNEHFSVYLARDEYFIIYAANDPDGANPSVDTEWQSVLYQADAVVYDASVFGLSAMYRLAGWSTERSGNIVYQPGDKITDVKSDIILYAQWDVAYTDGFGGSDYIFFPQRNPQVALLVRGGCEFVGVRDGDYAFSFTLPNGETLSGRVNVGHTFAYYREAVAGQYALVDTYYYGEDEEPEIDTSVTLTLDSYGGAMVEGLTDSPAVGVYSLDFSNDGVDYYYFEANDPSLGYFYFFITEYDGMPVFAMEGYELGIYNEFVLYDIDGTGYFTYYALYLDGYGAAAIINAQTYAYSDYGAYCIDILTGEGYYFSLTGGNSFAFTIVQINTNTVVYMRCDEAVRGEYTDEDSSAELTLDGYMNGSYYDGSRKYDGLYCLRSTEIFGLLVDFISTTGKSFTFRLSIADGSFSLFHDVKEYYWLTYDSTNGTQITSMPLIVLHDNAEKTADLYLYISRESSYEWTLVGQGIYTAESIGSYLVRYSFELTRIVDPDFIYYISFKSAVFFVNSLAYDNVVLNVYYLHEANSTVLYNVLYEADGDGVLHYVELGVSGMGTLYYDGDGTVYEGSLSYGSSQGYFRQNLLVFTTIVNGSYKYITFEVDTTNNTFVVLDSFPTELYYYDSSWNEAVIYDWELGRDILVSLAIDGKGNAAYLKYNDRGTRLLSETLGTYTYGGETAFGTVYYVFTPSDPSATVATFKFIMLSTGNADIFLRYDASFDTVLSSNTYGMLRLDGFSFEGIYTDIKGVDHKGQYRFATDNETLIYFISSSTVYFIDLTANSFTVRDALYGVSFIAVDDAFMPLGYVLRFNGYNAVSFYDVSGDPSDDPVAIGSYEILGSGLGEVLVSVVLDGVSKTYRFAFISMGSYYLCVVQNEENNGVYIADDWSMLVLDGYGLGTYIDSNGVAVEGTYHAIADTLIAFEGDGFDRLFTFDANTRKFAYVDNSQYYVVYYASDLSAIWFGEYAMINGVKAYYTVAADGITATLYYFDTSAAPYYYRAETMTLPQGATTEHDGKTFYRYTAGEQLTFMYYHESGVEPIAMELTFTPTGTAVFQTRAVFYDEPCYVSVNYEDGNVVVTILFEYISGESVFPTVLNYVPNGDSTCDVTIVPITTNLLSYEAHMYYYYYGYIPQGAFGYIDINMYYVGSRYLGYVLADGGFLYISDASGEAALEFTDEEVFETSEPDSTYGYMYMVYFERGEYAYEIDFYIDMSTYATINSRTYYCFILYLACVSNTSTDGEYSVTTVQYLGSNFAEYDAGTVLDYGLFKDGEYLETEAPTTDIRLAPDASYLCWIINSSTATQGILVTYSYNDYGFITGASIDVYDYIRIRSDDDTYLFGLLLDEDGDVVMVAQIGKQISEGRYYIQTITALSQEEGVWEATVYGNYQSISISITFVKGEDGSYTATVTVLE